VSDHAWKNLFATAKSNHSDEDKTQIKSEMVQDLVEELEFNFVMMGFPNYVFDHICQLGNFLHASSELPQ
jgi:hypothetical protein